MSTTDVNNKLAIVIPAYKTRFLGATLESLALQTVKAFTVYIGDDNSSDDVAAIVEPFRTKLDLRYRKFSNNLGQADLVAHWERCIAMTGNEAWLWILPDDDTASPECVEVFLAEVATDRKAEKLFRFQTRHIDAEGRVTYQPPACPRLESGVDFILNKLLFKRNSSVAEYIFSRSQYLQQGGFVHLPLAWGADDLLWTSLAKDSDIVTLPSGLVSLRQSELNISNSRQHDKTKLEAKYLFLENLVSLNAFTARMAEHHSNKWLQQVITIHLFNEYKSYRKKFSLTELITYSARNNRLIGGGLGRNLYRLVRYQVKNR